MSLAIDDKSEESGDGERSVQQKLSGFLGTDFIETPGPYSFAKRLFADNPCKSCHLPNIKAYFSACLVSQRFR